MLGFSVSLDQWTLTTHTTQPSLNMVESLQEVSLEPYTMSRGHSTTYSVSMLVTVREGQIRDMMDSVIAGIIRRVNDDLCSVLQ